MPERNYTNTEVRTMQQDAIRRVMEMQRIANERLQRSNAARAAAQQESERPADSGQHRQEQNTQQEHRNQQRSNQQRQNQQQHRTTSSLRNGQEGHSPAPVHHAMPVGLSGPPQNQQPQQPPSSFTSGALEGFVKRLGLETDQLILIGLLLLLINEGADTILIMAVFYLLI